VIVLIVLTKQLDFPSAISGMSPHTADVMTIDLRDHLLLDLFAEMDTGHEIGLLKGSIAVEGPGPRALHDPRTPGTVGIAAQAPDPVASMKEKPISQCRDGLHETCQRSKSLF
jgi:hypothetical protein